MTGRVRAMLKKENVKKNNKFVDIPINPNGQSGQLQQVSKKTTIMVWSGIIFLVLFIGVCIYNIKSNSEQLETTMYLDQYRLGSKTLTSAVQSYSVTGSATYYDEYFKELNEDKNRDIAWAGLQNNDITDAEWTKLKQIAALSDGLVPLEEAAMDYVKAGNLQAAQKSVFGDEYESTVHQISSLTTECIESIQSRMAKKATILNIVMIISIAAFTLSFFMIIQQIKAVMNFSRRELLIPIIKVSELLRTLAQGDFTNKNDMYEDDSEVGHMVAAINFMNQNYTKMISEISDVLGKMGAGNYKAEIKEEYVGEFVEIKDSMIKIMKETSETLDTLRTSAEEIGSGSEQLANAATDLAEGCTTQATKVAEVSEAIGEMAQAMDNEAKNATDTVEMSSGAAQVLNETNNKMQELKTAIGEISECSDQIRAIIGVIEDIAGQTNLLSLNASIEAARAGEAGRGFAVVAEQVKNLAEQSTQAAGETRKLIENTVYAVEKGITISDEVAEDMLHVIEGANQSTEKMSAMSVLIKKQSDNMRIINDNISSVAEIVDNNSAASEETAAISEEQTAQVQTMVHMMEKFEIQV